MNYQDLLNKIQEAAKKNPEILKQTVTILDGQADEFYPAVYTKTTDEKDCDVLDGGHLVIAF